MDKGGTPANGSLPDGLNAYKRTPVFTEKTVPQGLLNDHNTKAGVWGQINVKSGALTYVIASTGQSHILEQGIIGTVIPEQRHHVTPIGPVEFFVEFWR